MEPPEAYSAVAILFTIAHAAHIKPTKAKALRLKGAGPGFQHPHIHPSEYRIEGFEKNNFLWSGIPFPEFNERIRDPLNMGLGSRSLHNWSLLATAERRDAGGSGPLATPPWATASPKIREQHMQRVELLYCVLMNYISSRSSTYKTLMRIFNYDGVDAYEFVLAIGPISYPNEKKTGMIAAWSEMTMDKLNIKRTPDGLWVWFTYVEEQGRALRYDNFKIKDKFLDGLPEFMDAWKPQFKSNSTVSPLLGANYPPNYPARLQAMAHPHAGQPDLERMVRNLYPHWYSSIVKMKFVDRGIVALQATSELEAEKDDSDKPNIPLAMMSVADVNDDTPCYACGGKGHPATVKMEDGELIVCASKQIKNFKSTGKLATYTKNDSQKLEKYRKRAKQQAMQLAALKSALMAAQEESAVDDTEHSDGSAFTSNEGDDHDDDDQSVGSQTSQGSDMSLSDLPERAMALKSAMNRKKPMRKHNK